MIKRRPLKWLKHHELPHLVRDMYKIERHVSQNVRNDLILCTDFCLSWMHRIAELTVKRPFGRSGGAGGTGGSVAITYGTIIGSGFIRSGSMTIVPTNQVILSNTTGVP